MNEQLWSFWFNHKDDQSKRLTVNSDNRTSNVYFVFDVFTNKFDFLSDNVLNVLGYEKKEFTINTLINNIAPEDEAFVANCEKLCIEFQNTLFYEEHYKYSYRYSYRLINKNKIKLLIHQSYEALEVNPKGYLSKSIVKLYVSELPSMYVPDREVKIFDHSLGINVNLNHIKKLSKREREIVNLVHQGYTSFEIAEKLFVSKMTIDTHRRNILHKTNSSNFLDLMQKIKNL